MSPSYTFRKTKGGKSAYFQLGTNLKEASRLADRIATYLQQPANTVESAIAQFNPAKARPVEKGRVPTVGELIELYVRTSDNRDSTKDACTRAIRTIAAFIKGSDRLPATGRTKEVLERWRKLADSVKVDQITVAKLAAFRGQLQKL